MELKNKKNKNKIISSEKKYKKIKEILEIYNCKVNSISNILKKGKKSYPPGMGKIYAHHIRRFKEKKDNESIESLTVCVVIYIYC